MFEGIGTRGGTRGGKDQFNWSQVKADKYREFYLGQVKYFIYSLNSLFLIIKRHPKHGQHGFKHNLLLKLSKKSLQV